MIPRTLAAKLKKAAAQFPVVTVTGPRQSGKTTLVRAQFKQYEYVSLEAPDHRAYALEDPRGFLAQFKGPVVLDEVQRAPELFSYIQVLVDQTNQPGKFILTGSHNFLFLQAISQSLAGRSAVLHLLPFSLSELARRHPLSLAKLGQAPPSRLTPYPDDLMKTMFTGFYPRIHDRGINPRDWLTAYHQTYLERDVRNVLQVGDLESFGRFVRLCAGRNGQLLNLSGLAADCGITHSTAKRWISVLEASFIVMLLRPHHRNFGKRLIKSPKLYFLDTGLLCFLLRIQSAEDLHQNPHRGAVFESLVAGELQKNFLHRGEPPELYFWRDSAGHEIDFIIDLGNRLIAVEAKSGQTVASDFFGGLDYWRSLGGGATALIHGGDRAFTRSGHLAYPWFAL
jgi:hypothetical protein